MEQITTTIKQPIIKQRRYHRYEKGLESQERKFIDSAKMQSLLNKLSEYFGVQFEKPKFRPVYVNKRLKRWSGWFTNSRIDIADMGRYCMKDTLWHEILHGVINDNYQKVGDGTYKQYKLVQQAVYQLDNHGQHKAFKYQIICDCGHWLKSVDKRKKFYCSRCEKTVISPSQYAKLKKIATIGSSICSINIEQYKPWKENKFIGLKNLK